MSTIVNDLLASITTSVGTTLGSEYAELPYKTDVSKNNFNTNNNRYGVLANASLQVDSVTRFVTMSQAYEVVLTKAYADDGISDDDKQAQTSDAQDLVYDIYKSLVNTKAGIPSVVINITDLSIEVPEYLTEEKVVVIRASFNVLYRFTLI